MRVCVCAPEEKLRSLISPGGTKKVISLSLLLYVVLILSLFSNVLTW